jgi:hypothetical protein
MTITEFFAIKRSPTQIASLILQGMKQAPYPLFVVIKKTDIFTAVDHLIAFGLIFQSLGLL